jgi:predicted small integral membrane protein
VLYTRARHCIDATHDHPPRQDHPAAYAGGLRLPLTFDNLVDYGSNFAFVQHVLSMDTTFPGNALLDRSISSRAIGRASYDLIIAAEGATCLLRCAGSFALWRARQRDAAAFNAPKRLVTAGCAMGFIVWFFGFMVIGGEWFAMWQSRTWNGQDSAFKFYMTLLGVLVFVNQPDAELR